MRVFYGIYALVQLLISLAINADDEGGRSRSYSSGSGSGSSWGSGHK